jgi:hypothetical protein
MAPALDNFVMQVHHKVVQVTRLASGSAFYTRLGVQTPDKLKEKL